MNFWVVLRSLPSRVCVDGSSLFVPLSVYSTSVYWMLAVSWAEHGHCAGCQGFYRKAVVELPAFKELAVHCRQSNGSKKLSSGVQAVQKIAQGRAAQPQRRWPEKAFRAAGGGGTEGWHLRREKEPARQRDMLSKQGGTCSTHWRNRQ